jgi:Fur family ferric uptake transcriptional regulator
MLTIKAEIQVFREYIRRRGLRQTQEREKILEEITRSHDHFDVDELHRRLWEKDRKISKASIYRTLPLLLDCGLIREVEFSEGHWHYEHIYGHPHHCHLRCLSCGSVIEFEEPLLDQVQQNLAVAYGFIIKDHTLTVQGYCPQCQGARQAAPAHD